MSPSFEFNRVTFGLPVETFRVEAYIALEERLPVVTEFVLRLLKICTHVPLWTLRDYFGFTDGETLAIVESLLRQGLIEVLDDEAHLSSYTLECFAKTGGEYPTFSKVELKKDTVTFDLIKFTPLTSVGLKQQSDNLLKLDANEEHLGQSVDRAKQAYRKNYSVIASKRQDLREKSFGVYSVEDIESQKRNYAPVSVEFSLDKDGQVERRIDEIFERIAHPDLVQSVNEKITATIPKILSLPFDGLEDFIDTFDLKVMAQYLTGKKFDFYRYLADIHFTQSVKYPKGITPVFGNLYLPTNRDLILKRIQNRRQRKKGKTLTSLAWLVPDNQFWGRGSVFSDTVSEFANTLKRSGSGDDLFIFAYADKGEDQIVTNQFKVEQLKELHFSRPLIPDKKLMSGRLELLLYPTGFMTALIHISLSRTDTLWVPVGFISTLPKHLDTAQKLLQKAMSGNRYGKRARFGQKDARPAPETFKDACPFLQYSPLAYRHDEGDDD
jgi:hypothetical protein